MRRVRRYDFVGGSVSLGVGFEVSDAQARPSVTLSSWGLSDIELSATSPAPCLHAAMSTMMTID